MAAVLQTAVNCGVLVASLAVFLLADQPPRTVFLIGVLPALLVLWIRRAVPETEEWHHARSEHNQESPKISDLFRGDLRRTSILTLSVCALSLTAHWAFMFWCSQHLRNLEDIAQWTESHRNELVSQGMTVVMLSSIAGNFLAAGFARFLGYRWAIVLFCLFYFGAMFGAYGTPRDHVSLWPWLIALGICQGVFALFTMYLPPFSRRFCERREPAFAITLADVQRHSERYSSVYSIRSATIDWHSCMRVFSFFPLPQSLACCPNLRMEPCQHRWTNTPHP